MSSTKTGSTLCIATTPKEDRATAIGNMHKIDKDRKCGFEDILADRQTDTHTDILITILRSTLAVEVTVKLWDDVQPVCFKTTRRFNVTKLCWRLCNYIECYRRRQQTPEIITSLARLDYV